MHDRPEQPPSGLSQLRRRALSPDIGVAIASPSAIAIATLFGLLACGGTRPPRAAPGDAPGSGAADPMGVPAPAAASAAAATRRRLRRLNNAELDNVLSDLLGTRLSVTKGFLPEARVEGYDNDVVALGVSVSKVDELASAAQRAAAFVTAPANLVTFAPCPADADPESCASKFVSGFATRAWGRAPTPDEIARLLQVYRVGRDPEGHPAGLRLMLEAVLQAPAFVYRTELGADAGTGAVSGAATTVELTGDEIASALSFLLHGSRPDAELLRAAAAGELGSPEGRQAQARRLIVTPAARAHLAKFLRAWLGLGAVAFINKDTGVYPEFSVPVRQALDRELATFLEHVLNNENSSLHELLLADYTFPSAELLPIYGDDLLSAPGDFTRVQLAPRRRGLLSSPAFLATHGLVSQTNPIERGLMVLNRLFCQDIPPPPPDAAQSPPTGGDGITTRQRYEAHENDPRCSGCHRIIDPAGFGFEAFDTIGRFRTLDAGQPVDSSGALLGTDVDGPFDGPADLAGKLVQSPRFHRCFVQQMWRFAVGRESRPGDAPLLRALMEKFAASGYTIDQLLLALVGSPSFVLRSTTGEAP